MNFRWPLPNTYHLIGQPVFYRMTPPERDRNSSSQWRYSSEQSGQISGNPNYHLLAISKGRSVSHARCLDGDLRLTIQQLPLNAIGNPPNKMKIINWLYMGTFYPTETSIVERDVELLTNSLLERYYRNDAGLVPVHYKKPNPEIELKILYNDLDVVVVNKESRLLTTPMTSDGNSLMNGLIACFPHLAFIPTGGLVHRLDFDTSGACMMVHSRAAYNFIVLNREKMKRRYWCIVDNVMNQTKGTINAPVPSRGGGTRMDDAVTHFKVLEYFDKHTLVECTLETGRLNQIRIHMKYIGHPIVGDKKYNENYPVICRSVDDSDSPFSLNFCLRHFNHTALHAKELSFEHPRSRERISVSAELPYDFKKLLYLLRQQGRDENKRLLDENERLLEEGIAKETCRLETDLLLNSK